MSATADRSPPLETAADLPDALVSSNQAVAPPASERVGRHLQATRVAAGMSIEDVANSIKFSLRQIEALEADRYDDLPGMTIVRGFVRSYAKLLKLDATEMLALLESAAPPLLAEVRPPDNMGIAETPGARPSLGGLMSVAIVIVLAAAFLGLWHFFGPKPSASEMAIGAFNHAVPEKNSVPLSTTSPSGEPAGAVPGTAPATESDARPDNANSIGVPLLSAAPADSNTVAGTGADNALRFTFAARSWVEVSDATGKLLHSNENPAGSQLSVNGKPPYDVVIGNAQRVKLIYGDRLIDLVPHTRAEVARLKVE